MSMYYYEEEELINTPTFKDGVNSETESRYRTEGVKFIVDMGKKISLGYNTIATAVVFFHRFYMVHSFNDYPRYITACSCLFLAGKTEETPKRSYDLLKAAKEILSNDQTIFEQKLGPDPRRDMMTFESVLLQTINFEFEVEHPYKYLLKFVRYLKGDKTKMENVVQMAWNFLNDSLRTTLCIQWEPEVIAIALIYLSTKLSSLEIVNWKGKKPEHQKWWDLFVSDLDKNILEDICNQILDLYPDAKPSSTSDSPLSTSSNEAVTVNPNIPHPVVPVFNTFDDPESFSNISCPANVVYLPGLPPVNLAIPPPVNLAVSPPVNLPVPPPMNFSLPPPNFNPMHPTVLPPNSFNIPPPSLPTFPFYNQTINLSCFTLTPDSPFINHQVDHSAYS